MSYQALLFCPDDKTARVVTQVLTELDFTVEPCNEPFAAVKKLMAQHFDAIVVDCDNEQNAALLFKSARNSATNQSSLSVAVVEGQAGVAKAFRIGANLVLTKPINVEQSKGTLRVARGLLRKADSSRPAAGSSTPSQEHAAPPAATTPTPARPFAPLPGLKGTPSFSSSPKAPAAPVVPVATQSGFEVENDPVPAPDSTEAALLESMPDPVSPVSQPEKPPASMTKEYPWQPMAKPISEPMASALRRAEEAAHKPTASVPPTVSEPDYSLSAADILGDGAGTATAPAKEKEKEAPRPAVKPFPTTPASVTPVAASIKEIEIEDRAEASKKIVAISDTAPAIEPPTFSAYSIKDHEQLSEEGSGKNKLFVVLAAVVLIAAAYFGWTKMHSTAQPSNPVKQVTPATPQAPASSVQPAAVGASGSPSEIVEPPTSSQHGASSTSAKPSPATKTSPAATAAPVEKEPEVVVRQMPQETVVVKTGDPVQPVPKPAAVEVPQPAPPEALGIASNSDDKTISGLVRSAPVSVPKAVAPQTVRVSQGVSQGLLSKRVQPVYPSQAMQMRLQGAVQLQATISKDGSVTNLKVLSGDGVLARAAMDAVKQWKYKPYYLNGEPIEIQTQITVNFKLP
jgi:protein TonB